MNGSLKTPYESEILSIFPQTKYQYNSLDSLGIEKECHIFWRIR